MADIRRPFPQFNAFRSFVMKELSRRKNQHEFPPQAPFVRLTSCMMEKEMRYAFFTLGLHGLDMGQDLNIFDEIYGSRRDIVGYAYDMKKRRNGRMAKILISTDKLTMDDFTKIPNISKNLSGGQLERLAQDRASSAQTLATAFANGAHPIPGITHAEVKMRGLGQPLVATVTWKCYNQGQMEYLRHHFMTAGNYIVLEWGNQFADKKITKTLDFSDDATTRRALAMSVTKGRKYVVDNYVEPNDGNYNFLVGRVGNFTVDMDAKTNIYTCTTTLVSVGEQFYGVSVDTTFVRVNAAPDSAKQSSINTVLDWFKPGMGFDKLVNGSSTDPKLVAGNFANWGKNNKNINEKSSDLKNVSFNPEDYRFISWEFFCKKLMPEVLSLIKHPNAVNDLPRLLNFWPDENASDDETEWIGCNEFLRSCEPDTMLIITSKMDKVPGALTGAGKFDDPKNVHRGSLARGVWLNAGMVRAAFTEAINLERAISGMLIRMNNATAGFWGLRLFYDEDAGRYRILDGRYTETKNAPAFWKFNEGAKGECLNIKFDAAFPPELVTQMMMYARYKSETPKKQKELIERFPMIGTTSAFALAVNYTNLVDILSPDVDKVAGNAGAILEPLGGDQTAGRSPDDAENQRAASKVIGLNLEPAPALTTDGKSADKGQKISTPKIKLPDALAGRDATLVDGSIRNSPLPPLAKLNLDTAVTQTSKLDADFFGKLDQLRGLIRAQGYNTKILETHRSQQRQDFLFAKGRTTDGPMVTKTRRSLHTLGKACDLQVLDARNRDVTQDFYPNMVLLCKQVGLETIGDWDAGHVQVANGNALQRNASLWEMPSSPFDPVRPEAPSDPNLSLNENGYEIPDTNSETVVRETDFSNRFGNEIFAVIEVMHSALLNKITRSGFDKYPTPNAFVFAFPTTTAVTVELVGIGGISISDGFYVDKLPFIFERHGVFQCTEITETIAQNGWTTSVRGVFKMLWLEGKEKRQNPVTVMGVKV